MSGQEDDETEEEEEVEEDESEEDEGEFLQDDIGQVYSLPEARLVSLCNEMGLDPSGSQHVLASRVLDKMEEEIAADPSAPGLRGIGCMRSERLRGSLGWEERLNEAERLKDAANEKFKAGQNDVALAAYLAAVWLLKPDNPLAPEALETALWQLRADHALCPSPLPPPQPAPRGFEGVRLLGEGIPLTTALLYTRARKQHGAAETLRHPADLCHPADLPADLCKEAPSTVPSAVSRTRPLDEMAISTNSVEEEGRTEWLRWCHTRKRLASHDERTAVELGARIAELRVHLHLNVAASALRLTDCELADRACAFVLQRRAAHPKALLRQAAALKGLSDLKGAARVLETLLALPGQLTNLEARKLHAEICSARRERTAQKAAWIEGQARSVCESRAKLEADAQARAAEEEARAHLESDNEVARVRELAATTQVHAPPPLGSRVEVWWEGDKKWSTGTVLSRAGTAALPKFRVLYEDGFEFEHDLTSSDKKAFPFRLLAPPPSAMMSASGRLTRRVISSRLARGLLGSARTEALDKAVRDAISRDAISRRSVRDAISRCSVLVRDAISRRSVLVRDAISRRSVLSAGLPLRARLFGVVVVGTGVLVLAVAILVQLARAPGLTAAPPLASLDGDSQALD